MGLSSRAKWSLEGGQETVNPGGSGDEVTLEGPGGSYLARASLSPFQRWFPRGPERIRQGLSRGHTPVPQASPLHCFKEVAGEWNQPQFPLSHRGRAVPPGPLLLLPGFPQLAWEESPCTWALLGRG